MKFLTLLSLIAALSSCAPVCAQIPAGTVAFDVYTGAGWAEKRVTPGANSLMGYDGSALPATITAGTGISIVNGVISMSGSGLPSQTSHSGQYLTTNGTNASWADVFNQTLADALYSPLGHAHTFASLTSKPSTITGYGITDAFTQALADALYSPLGHVHTFASLTSRPTTVSGYGITDAFTQTLADARYSALAHTHTFASLTSKPTSLAGYGITDSIALTSGSYANPSWITSLAWSKISSTPTTLAGYGITDSIALTSGSYANPSWITSLVWSKISSTPTTLAGYGITDATALPSVTSQGGKILSNNGTSASWVPASDPGGPAMWGWDRRGFFTFVTLGDGLSMSGDDNCTLILNSAAIGIGNSNLENDSITIAGSDTALGGSISATTILDSIGSTRGSLLYRGASGWAALAPGTDGKTLTTHGSGADPTWETPSGGAGGGWVLSTAVLCWVDETAGDDSTGDGAQATPYATIQAAYDDGFRRFAIIGAVGNLTVTGTTVELYFFGFDQAISHVGSITKEDAGTLTVSGNGSRAIAIDAIYANAASGVSPGDGGTSSGYVNAYSVYAGSVTANGGAGAGGAAGTSGGDTAANGTNGTGGGTGGNGGTITLRDVICGSVSATGGAGGAGGDGGAGGNDGMTMTNGGVGGSAGAGGSGGIIIARNSQTGYWTWGGTGGGGAGNGGSGQNGGTAGSMGSGGSSGNDGNGTMTFSSADSITGGNTTTQAAIISGTFYSVTYP